MQNLYSEIAVQVLISFVFVRIMHVSYWMKDSQNLGLKNVINT